MNEHKSFRAAARRLLPAVTCGMPFAPALPDHQSQYSDQPIRACSHLLINAAYKSAFPFARLDAACQSRDRTMNSNTRFRPLSAAPNWAPHPAQHVLVHSSRSVNQSTRSLFRLVADAANDCAHLTLSLETIPVKQGIVI